MALRVIEFFGYAPLDPAADEHIARRSCPFVKRECIKPEHGACSVRQLLRAEPVICCPNRMYGDGFRILEEIATEAFGPGVELVRPADLEERAATDAMTGHEVAVFGRYWGKELALPRPQNATSEVPRQYYVDWILAKLDRNGDLTELTAVEVQTVDTTGNYKAQAESFFQGQAYHGGPGRDPAYSNASMNWENVNKRILPQIIYKGHVLRREAKCRKGLYFVCPKQVYDRIRDRLGGTLHAYHPSQGTITFRSYELGPTLPAGQHRAVLLSGQFTTTVDQVALAFTSPMNLPDQNVYEAAITAALSDVDR